MRTKFSIVVPVFFNELNLDTTIPALLSLEKNIKDIEIELVFVDDGSGDKSFEILKSYTKLNKRKIKIVKFTKNFGQTPAIQAGLRIATGDCVGIISADLQEPYELFIQMHAHWKDGKKFVIAERTEREENFFHRFLSNLYWGMIRKIALSEFPKGGFDFCLLDRQLVNDLNACYEKNTSIFPLIFSFGYSPFILSYTRRLRTAGKSGWTFRKKAKIFIDTAIAFSYFPIRFVSYIGISVSVISISMALFYIFSYFYFNTRYPGWTTIIVLIFFFGGLILITLGLIGEYLWRILDEVRKRPNYVIEEILE